MEKQREELKRKKVKNTKAYNLFKRLTEFKTETLNFMSDFTIPFDNNGSERDVRMAKLKQKISGCFRSADGGSMFARIRSYLSSARKQGMDIYQSLLKAVLNYSNMPLLGADIVTNTQSERKVKEILKGERKSISNEEKLVGVERFELPTSCSQSRRATRLRYTPLNDDYHIGFDQ